MIHVTDDLTMAVAVTYCITVPQLHYLLLSSKSTRHQPVAVGLVMVMVIVGVPLLFTSNQMAIRMAAGNIGIICLLKSIQAMVTQPSINSLREYGMFLASTRDLSQPIRLSKKRKAFQKEDRSIMYWIAEGTRWLALYTFYCIGRILMAQYPLDPQGFGLVSPFDLNGMRDQIVFFILFWSQLELGYSVVFHLISVVTGVAYEPIMYSPYFSTSLREFWSLRWNMLVKDFLTMIVFNPVFNAFPQSKKNKKASFYFSVACLSAFLFSGILHEYIAFLQFGWDSAPPRFENLLFFGIHGCLVCCQVWMQDVTGFGVSWGFGWLWDCVCWVATILTLLCTTRLFSAQYVRSGIGGQVSFPVPSFIEQYMQ